MTAERRREHVEPTGGSAEMQFFGDRNKAAELMQFHASLTSLRWYYINILYNPMAIAAGIRPL